MKAYLEEHLDKILIGLAVITVCVWIAGVITVMDINKEIELEKSKLGQYETQLRNQNED